MIAPCLSNEGLVYAWVRVKSGNARRCPVAGQTVRSDRMKTDLSIQAERWLPTFGRYDFTDAILVVSRLLGNSLDILEGLCEFRIGGIVDRAMLQPK